MNRMTRTFAFLFVACLALSLASCSNNKGKIQGKWKATNMPDMPPGVDFIMEFGSDGSLKMTIAAPMLPGAGKTITGKYKLGWGDNVTLYDLSEELSGSKKHTEKVTINGDTLTMKDSDGTTATFKKMN